MNNSLQIQSAELQIGKELSKIQYYLKTWFYSCSFMGILCLFMLESCLWSFLVWIRIVVFKRIRRKKEYDESFMDGGSNIFNDKQMNDDQESEYWEDMSITGDDSLNHNDDYDDNVDNVDKVDNDEDNDDNEDNINWSEISDNKNNEDELNSERDTDNINVKMMPLKRKISTKEDEKMRAEKLIKGEMKQSLKVENNSILSKEEEVE